VDVVFALDASGSIESDTFARVVQFVGAVVHSLTIRTTQTPNGFQVALVSFANRVDIRFHLNTFTDKELLLAAINMPYTGGRTNLDLALRYALPCNVHSVTVNYCACSAADRDYVGFLCHHKPIVT